MAAPVLVWFRRDLRLEDHPALSAAIDENGPVVPLVVLDPTLDVAPVRSRRYAGAVAALDRDLRAIGGRLVIRTGAAADVVPMTAREAGAIGVFTSRSLTPLGRRREAAVESSVRLRRFPGEVAIEPEQTGPTKVFAAFHRRWLAADRRPLLPAPTSLDVPPGIASEPTPDVAPEGALEARRRLAAFAASRASRYATDRNRLDLDGSSQMSADLHLGTVSPLQVLAAVDSDAFARELAWRDWAAHLLWFDPASSAADEPGWRVDAGALAAWREGRTGYPTVDAAMRQLAAEGWISNRARLIVASFLTKDLLIDWREGERHFLRTLVDGDVASNRMNWRWSAGVGPDAAPYMRVMNPSLQGERFDPDGRWVRRWVPEIAALPNTLVHRPWLAPGPPPGYPPPIVEHAAARERALAAHATAGRRAASLHPSR